MLDDVVDASSFDGIFWVVFVFIWPLCRTLSLRLFITALLRTRGDVGGDEVVTSGRSLCDITGARALDRLLPPFSLLT